MPTEKLYWKDPFAMTFDAPGAEVSTFQGKPAVVLPSTLFYPEAGGQLGDTGVITFGTSAVAVSDTQISDDGVIYHLVDAPPPALGERPGVRGVVDRPRRLDHMAHHTAQHMLSSALADVAKAETVSARLGNVTCTIDLDVPQVSDSVVARVEDTVNAVIRDDVPIRAFFPTEAELRDLKLRRAPKVTHGIRVIDIEGFDLSPCGGTHCTRTGQVAVVRVTGTERYKGKVRVSFHAAARAVADAQTKDALLRALMGDLTCGAADLPMAVGKLKADLQDARQGLGHARAELAGLVAERALAAHAPAARGKDTRIVLLREKDDVATLRVLAGRLAAREDVVAICLSRDAGEGAAGDLAVVVQRGTGSTFDCGAWLKGVALASGGRGGGRPERAEGRLPIAVLPALVAEAPLP